MKSMNWGRVAKAFAAAFLLGLAGLASAATALDLGVSAYTWSPDPVVRGGSSTFSVTVTNNSTVDAADTLSLVVNLPSNVSFAASTPPANCAFTPMGTPTTLTCTNAVLAASGTWVVSFNGTGDTAGVQTTSATISSTSNSDTNTGNDVLTKSTTVINGADLAITKTGPGSALADAVISFNLRVVNNGPDAASLFRVTDNLPAATDFTYQSATGTNWSCAAVGTLLTCDYGGASIALGGAAPDITVTGRIILTSGNITNGASVATTDGTTGDPVSGNNGPSLAVVPVTQTTDLRANKTMVSVATSSTSYALSEAVTLTLSVTNQGPRDATGVTVVDTVPAGFTLGTMPSGCARSGQIITCTVSGTLSNGATSSSFVIPLTAPASASSGTNTATPTRTTPAAGANTVANVNYTVSTAASNLQANKTMVSTASGATTYAFGEAVTLALSVRNNGPQNATGVTVADSVPTGFTIGTLPSGCAAVGQAITCTVSGTLNNGATSSNFVIPLTAPLTPSTGTNTATPARSTPAAGSNSTGSVNYTVAAPSADLRANKTMVSVAPGSTNGTSTYVVGLGVTLTLSVTNLGLQDATGVTVSDTVSSDFSIGTLPTGCSAVGQLVSCNVGNLANGATSSSFTIPLTALVTSSGGSNTASPARVTPTAGTDTPATPVNYTIIPPYAHLTLTKNKTPALVAAGANLTNTIVVTNSSTSSSPATGVIRVTDVLSANETYVGNNGGGWACAAAGSPETVTCDYDLGAGSLARTSALPNLVITTQAGAAWLGTLSNTACTGLSALSPHQPPDTSTTGNCATTPIYSTPRDVDLSITKSASITAPTHMLASDASISYTLTVSNASADVAPTVTVTDPLPGFIGGSTTGSATITGAAAGESCSFAATVSCTLKDVTNGAPRTITIVANRRLTAGTFTNTATLSSPDALDTAGVKSASANIIVDSAADVAVTAMAASPNPVQVGVALTYTTSIKNNGPDTAAGVVLRQRINLAAWTAGGTQRMSYVAGSAAIAGATGASCSFVTFSGSPYAGDEGIECTGFGLISGESRQLVFRVVPVYYASGYPDPQNQSCSPAVGSTCAPFVSDATISTTTGETDAPVYANNSRSNTVQITSKQLDLSVTNNDPGFDPTAFGNAIVYTILAQNNGPSQANGFKLTVTPTPPAQGAQASPYTMVYNAAGSTVLPVGASCSVVGSDVVCYLGASQASSVQAPNTSATFLLQFDTGPGSNAPPTSITYQTTAKVESYETGVDPFTGDSLSGNNKVTETTTVLPKTDLQIVSKSVSKPVVDLNEEFLYTITLGNKGPSDASGIRVTDVLPAGLVRTSTAVVVTPGASVTLVTNSCTGPAAGAGGTLTCDLGPIPNDPAGTTPGLQVTIAIPVRAAYQASGTYSFGSGAVGFDTNFNNTASIAPLPNTSIDATAANNTATATVQVRKNSIAGFVYADNDLSDTMLANGNEGLNSVVLTLTGTDSFGFTYGAGQTYAALTATTAGSGASKGGFLFDKLPPGNWTLVETQPIGYWDRFETAGTAGGTVPAATCDGAANCGSTATQNTISAIALPANTATAATGYLFQEYQAATISGIVYSDANNNGIKAAGEGGINAATVTLSGTAYNGVNVCTLVTCALTTPTTTAGTYSYANLPPSNSSGYSVTETQPSGYLNGLNTSGTATGTNSVAGVDSVSGTASGSSSVIQAIRVFSNGASPNNNFGELLPATLSGFIFIDSLPNGALDAQRDAVNETAGIPGLTVTLTGTNDLGATVNTTATTGVSGAYSFTNLRPGTYTVTETSVAVGLTHTGAQAGSKGGTIAGSARTAGTGVTGVTNRDISAIALVANDTASGYNFGESGQGLSGFVYMDLNSNGIKDVGEPGIPGVSVTLSGTTSGAQSVCTAISPNPCTLVTNASGQYSFIGIPASDSTGYTLTEQLQTSSPLSNYADGLEQLGTGLATPGVVGSDVFSGIVLPVGGVGTAYNYGELGAKLSGTVYFDADNSGTLNGSEVGIGGVTLTLSGTTASNADVCTTLTSLALSCTLTSLADGTFAYTGLPASNATGYTLTETQPINYANGTDTPGTGCGTASCGAASVLAGNSRFTALQLAVGANATGYLFGEKGLTFISGAVFNDSNRDGTLGGAEPGVGGVSLKLVAGNDCAAAAYTYAGLTNPVTSAVTTGAYSFTPVPAGSQYTVCETQPAGYADGPTGAGTAITIASLASTGASGNNFPEVLGSLAGLVYADFGSANAANNNNGSKDTGEPGIGSATAAAGVPITLTGTPTAGPSLAPVTLGTYTDANGAYSFADLFPGSYRLVAGAVPVALGVFNDGINTPGPVSAGGTVGTAGAVGLNSISAVGLAAGSQGTGNNFAKLEGASISGTVYLDLNTNGSMDAEPTDSRLAGVTLTLYSGTACTGTPVGTTTSATNGSYRFGNLASGANYTVCETQPGGYDEGTVNPGTSAALTAATANAISVSNLPSTGSTGNNFGERGGSLSGFVYVDVNNNGSKDTATDAREVGLANVHVTLSGTTSTGFDVCTLGVTCSVTTSGTGAFSFPGVPPGTYQLVETQTDLDGALYADGKETAGLSGGVVDNSTQGSQAYQNTIKTIVVTPATLAAAAGNLSGYLFGELPRSTPGLKTPIVSGHIYMDRNHSRIRPADATLDGQAVWTVTLSQNGNPVCTVTSDATGFYQFDNLHCPAYVSSGLPTGTGFSIRFTNSGNNLPNLPTSGGSAGTASAGLISNITINANDEITEQNLPLDPAGLVYNVLTRQPVAGATVVISGPPGFNPASHLVGGAATQTTGTDGRYSFWLQNAYPSGTYSIAVTAPAGYYQGTSLVLPPCAAAPLSVGAAPDPGLVQQSNNAPALSVTQHAPAGSAPCVGMVAGGALTTQYYLSFGITNGVSASILNNQIPLDPVVATRLVLTKTGNRQLAEVGDSVLYTIAVRNGTGANLPQVTVRDSLPAGFTLIRGTARVNGNAVADPLGGLGPVLGFNLGALANGSTSTLTYRVRIGVGSQQGNGINTAQAHGCGYASGCLDTASLQPLPRGVASNQGQFRVQVTGGVFTDAACVLGKVFVDCNNNHVQDPEELGIPGVRLYFEDGHFAVTDSEGKYSRCGIPPRSHVLTPDPATLPRGAVLTTTSNRNLGDANSLFIDLKNGELHRADFAEGSCANPVLEQVKARRSQGEVRSVETEKSNVGKAGPALRFQSKPLRTPQQGTDSADQPLVQPRQGASDAQ